MSSPYSLNQTPSTGGAFVLALCNLIVANGGTQGEWSDGTTHHAGGGSGPAAGNLDHTDAYDTVTDASGHQHSFQRGSTGPAWRWIQSPTAALTGGTATQQPASSDQQTVWGGGTNASPTFTSVLGTDNTYHSQFYAASATPYGWWGVAYPNGGGATNGELSMLPVAPPTGVTDTDPYVYIASAGPKWTGVSNTGVTVDNSVAFYLNGTTTWTTGSACYFGNGNGGNSAVGTNPISGNYDSRPILYSRPSRLGGTNGDKGWDKLQEWSSTTGLTVPSVVNYQGGSLNKWCPGDVFRNWDGATTPTT
jgi:hypothetical protein